jgi:CubicO group peptidase (beta-lactamase class C family)
MKSQLKTSLLQTNTNEKSDTIYDRYKTTFTYMKTVLITILSLFFLFFTTPKSINNGLFSKKDNDSTLISIPFHLKFGNVSEKYISEKRSIIDSFYNKNIKSPYYSGGFIVAKNGKILYEDYQGFADAKKNIKIDYKTPIHLASVSKVLTATAILKLVQNDNLELDQKVTDWLPKFPYKQTTIRTLLNHRSGLPHYDNFIGYSKRPVSNKDVLDVMIKNKIKLAYNHNATFDYCNTNYVVLALIIEKATGMNYRKAMQELIFKPIGMTDTYVFNYETDRDSASKSYKGNTQWPWEQFDDLYGDKNIYSTPRDLVKFDMATYSPDFIKPELLQEAYKGYSPNPIKMKDYGLGMRMRMAPNGNKQVYHNGWWHGNNTSFVPVKKDTITIICLGNKYSNRPYSTLNLVPIL